MPTLDSQRIRAIALGAETWTVFGLLELFFLGVTPQFCASANATKSYEITYSFYVVARYGLWGGLIGGAAALIEKREPGRLARLFAACVLIASFSASRTMVVGAGFHSVPEAVYYVALFVAVIAGWKLRGRTSGLLDRPFALGLLLVAAPWVISCRAVSSGFSAAAVFLGAGCAALLVSLAGARVVSWAGLGFRGAAVLGSAALATSAILLVHPKPLVVEGGSSRRVSGPGRPNVVLICLDTVRRDHMSVYGYHRDTTPTLREFARTAVVFTGAVASGDMTLISHASLFTGLAGYEHGVHASVENPYGRPLADKFVTLAEILRDRGYRTYAVVANTVFLSREYGFAQGFEYFDDRWPRLAVSDVATWSLRGAISLNELWDSPWSARIRRFRSADEINEEAVRLLDVAGGRPLFLFLNYMDAHTPYIPPEPFATMFPGRLREYGHGRWLEEWNEILKTGAALPEEARAHLISQYDGAIAYIDNRLGRLFQELKWRGMYDNSLIVVFSDHGEAFGEDGEFGHPMSVREHQVAIPLLMKLPGSVQQRKIHGPVGLRDVMPTILRILGLPTPEDISGRDLLSGEPFTDATAVAEAYPFAYTLNVSERFRRVERAIYWKRWKFIGSDTGKRELYDLRTDPAETNNLYDPACPVSARLESVYERIVRDARRSQRPTVEPKSLKRLQSLGYVQQ